MDKWKTYLRCTPLAGIATLLLMTFHLYRSAYFWLDDFNNLYWVQRTSGSDMLKALIDPRSSYFRPAGMSVYWVLLHIFGAHEAVFHFTAWLLHAINTAMVYIVLKRLTQSFPGAAFGSMLFACQTVFTNVYWSFGDIFELLCCFFFLLGVALWTDENRSWIRAAACTCIFILAMKSKEMAATLPAIWLSADLLMRRKLNWRRIVQIALPLPVAVFFFFKSVAENKAASPAAPYYMNITGIVLGRGFGGYFDALFRTSLRWQYWAIGFAALLLLLIALRRRPAIFFQLWVFVTFLPVIFLVNHRSAFYWYIPFVGVCGLAALAVKAGAEILEARIPLPGAGIAASILFLFLCGTSYEIHREQSAQTRSWQHNVEVEYRAYVSGLQSLPQLPPQQTLYFISVPRYVEADTLESSVQVALRRMDVDAVIVDSFPAGARYRLRFVDGELRTADTEPR